MTEDAALLHRYAEERAEDAFAAFVQRHLTLVYFAALRRTGNASLAQDVTQYVFTAVARDAAALSRHATLAGWLYTTTRYAAAKALRSEQRRKIREQEAQTMNDLASPATPIEDWEKLRPVLDAALDELNEREREAVLLRCLEGRAFSEVASTLHVTEDAARMRVDRALDKLRAILSRRGVTSTAVALAGVLANQAAATVPNGIAAAVTSAATVGAAGPALSLFALKLSTFMSTTKIAVAVAGALVIASTAVTVHQQRTNTALQNQILALSQQADANVASLRAENQRLQRAAANQDEKTRAEHDELMRLRAGVEAYRKQQAAARRAAANNASGSSADANATNAGTQNMVPVTVMHDVGRATPRAAAQTQLWAMQNGDVDAASQLLTMDPAERGKLQAFMATLPADLQQKYDTPEKVMAFLLSGSPKPLSSVQLLSEQQPTPDEMVQQVQIQFADGESRQDTIRFRQDEGGWKQVVSPKTVDALINYFGQKQK